MVSGVQTGSRAAMDGLRIGDIIVEINGQMVDDLPFVQNALEKSKRPLQTKIYRNRRFLTLSLHPE